jgi:hypothetical protein
MIYGQVRRGPGGTDRAYGRSSSAVAAGPALRSEPRAVTTARGLHRCGSAYQRPGPLAEGEGFEPGSLAAPAFFKLGRLMFAPGC